MSMELRSPFVKALLVLACLVVLMAGIKAASTIMVPFFLSIFIAIACSPIIHWTSRFGVPKWLSITLVILLIVVFGFLLAGLVGQSLTEFRENLPQYRTQLDSEFSWIVEKLAQYNIHINRELIASHLDPATAMSVATNFISGMGGVLSNLFLILLTVIFMLFEADSIPRRLHIALADPDMKLQHIDRFIRSVNSYLAIKTVVSLGTGLIIGITLYAMNIDHFMLWAVLAFMLNFIPNIGSIIAALPAVLIAFVQYGLASAGFVALAFVLVNTIMGNMVEPRLMGRGMGLSTLVVFLSLIFWGWLLGTVGMLLSVPLTMVVKIALESRDETKWLAVLLSSEGEKTTPA
ncbi:membrane protein [Alteromonas australica]|uniref:AI-2E family transporter n=1 Tax=Alteromonas australica TaxID=589873 RepID=UPI0005C3F6BB|nr:AI-2E family transporter [Alteromonas australica]AJP43518.1 membrane protein [Alteromonas australica]HBF70358.1 AI-2E family transporter [Alteromonas australica]